MNVGSGPGHTMVL